MLNKIHHLGWHDGVELIDIELRGHPFGKHSHNAYAIGVIESGVGGNIHRGERRILPSKTVSLINPDEPHDGFAISESIRYKMVYISEASMRDIIGEKSLNCFRECAAHDIDGMIAASLNDITIRLERKNHVGWKLAVDSELMKILQMVMLRYSGARPVRMGKESRAINIVKDYLDSLVAPTSNIRDKYVGEMVTLEILAKLVGLNKNYLLNIFTRHVGVPPYMYWTARRIEISKRLLMEGRGISHVAQELGFYDQAHFSRAFKKMAGVTPSRFVVHR